MAPRLDLFYASDIHGSERVFRKFLNAAAFYKVQAVVFGGDLTGKAIVPFTQTSPGQFEAEVAGTAQVVSEGSALEELEKFVRDRGAYPYRTTPEEVAALAADPELLTRTFSRLMLATAETWVTLADERLRAAGIPALMMPGNDDEPAVKQILAQGDWITDAEDQLVDLNGYQVISFGWATTTPWHSPREVTEAELGVRLGRAGQLDPGLAGHLQLPRPARPVRAGPGLQTDRRPEGGDGGRPAHARPGRQHRGARPDRTGPAGAVAARAHPRIAGVPEDRQDAGRQSGQRLHRGRAARGHRVGQGQQGDRPPAGDRLTMAGRVIVVGDLAVDCYLRLPADAWLPADERAGDEFAGDEKVTATEAVRQPGGTGANAAVAARVLGSEAGLCSAVGDDPYGPWLTASASARGVGGDAIRSFPGSSTHATILLTGARRRVIVERGVADQLDQLDPPVTGAADVVYLTGSGAAVRRMADAGPGWLPHRRAGTRHGGHARPG